MWKQKFLWSISSQGKQRHRGDERKMPDSCECHGVSINWLNTFPHPARVAVSFHSGSTLGGSQGQEIWYMCNKINLVDFVCTILIQNLF